MSCMRLLVSFNFKEYLRQYSTQTSAISLKQFLFHQEQYHDGFSPPIKLKKIKKS